MDTESESVLDRKHVGRMLVYILNEGVVGSMDFSWLTTNWKIIDENLRAMVDAGLLEIHIPPKGRKTLRYYLTDKGKLIAITELIQRESIRGTFSINDDIIRDDILKLWENHGKLVQSESEILAKTRKSRYAQPDDRLI